MNLTLEPIFVVTADGKLVTEPSLLAQFNIPIGGVSLEPLSENVLKSLKELTIIILPIIMGGHKTTTIMGGPGDFLKAPIAFELSSKRVRKGVCYLRYSLLPTSLYFTEIK
ncbi:MAG TPA: hypothetical protein VJK54_03605 [Chthoniobacterales bacterium]|nr:hypothetical protein [Chthoniobacterales bacterium]